MTGPEHYREAERLMAHAVTIFDGNDRQHQFAGWEIQQAQIHATLALAAATALVAGDDGRTPLSAYDEWQAVAGGAS